MRASVQYPLQPNTKGTSSRCKSLCILTILISTVALICITLFYRNSDLNSQSPAKSLLQSDDIIHMDDDDYITTDPPETFTTNASNTSQASEYYNANGAHDLIDSLPNLIQSTCLLSPTKCKFKQYSGYLLANNNREIHYWFIQSERKPHKKPVFIWTNGGPGCSGLLALLTEHGPWKALKNNSIAYNPYAWTNDVNMLYLEQPYGVGFSSVDEGRNVIGGDQNAADDMDAAVRDFINKFPSFAHNKFYLSSESWGGHYVPVTTYTILQNNENGSLPYINFGGFLVGNAFTDPYENAYGVVGDIYGHGLLKHNAWHDWRNYCWNNVANMDNSTLCEAIYIQAWYNVRHANAYALDFPQCADDTNWLKDAYLHRRAKKSMEKVLQFEDYDALNMGHIQKSDLEAFYDELTKKLSVDISEEIDDNVRKNKGDIEYNSDKIHDEYSYEPCVEAYMHSYLNLEEVQTALHVKPISSWSDCSSKVAKAWPDSDWDTFMQPYYTNIVNNYVDELGLTLGVFSGDDDSVCGLEGTMFWLDRWGFDVNEEIEWQQWKDANDQLAGYYTQYLQENENVALHFITVRSAGHMVPTTQPQRALRLLRKFLYSCVETTVGVNISTTATNETGAETDAKEGSDGMRSRVSLVEILCTVMILMCYL